MSVVSATVVVHLLALQFVLNSFTVGSIADEGENRTNALDKKGALGRFRIVKCSLDVISRWYFQQMKTPT